MCKSPIHLAPRRRNGNKTKMFGASAPDFPTAFGRVRRGLLLETVAHDGLSELLVWIFQSLCNILSTPCKQSACAISTSNLLPREPGIVRPECLCVLTPSGTSNVHMPTNNFRHGVAMSNFISRVHAMKSWPETYETVLPLSVT